MFEAPTFFGSPGNSSRLFLLLHRQQRLIGGLALFISSSSAAAAKQLELGGQVHLAEEEYPEDEEADQADAHDKVEVGPLRLVLRLADGKVQVVGGVRPPALGPGGGGRRRRGRGGRGGRGERVVRDDRDAGHLHLQGNGL